MPLVYIPAPENLKPEMAEKIITFRIGNPGTLFHLPANEVMEHNPFFDAAIDRGERTFTLRTDSPEVFRMYTYWLKDYLVPPMELSLLVDCYIFGESVQDKDFMDAVMDKLLEATKTEGNLPYHLISKIYENTHEGSPAQMLAADCSKGYWQDNANQTIGPDFGWRCKYHAHRLPSSYIGVCYRSRIGVRVWAPEAEEKLVERDAMEVDEDNVVGENADSAGGEASSGKRTWEDEAKVARKRARTGPNY